MPNDARTVLRRFDRLVAAQAIYRPYWQDLADQIQPQKSEIVFQRAPGLKRTERLFDSTAIHANELLAASLHGALTPSASKWFGLRERDESLNDIQEVKEWLEDVTDRMLASINQSNFAQEVDEVFLDISCFGTSAIFLEAKDAKPDKPFTGFRFTTIQFGAFFIDEDANDTVNVLFRRFKMSPRAVAGRWPDSCGDAIKAKAENGDQGPIEVIHGVFPENWTNTTTGKQFPFYSAYVVRTGTIMLEESGFHEFPFMVPRWRKSAGEVYGRGPGHTALPDIRSLNKAKETELRSWAKELDPASAVFDNAVVGTVKQYPGALTVVKQMGAGKVSDVIGRLFPPVDMKANMIKGDELKQSIRQIFFTDQLEPLGSINDRPDMTATEATIRNELMLRLLGPTAGRLQSELLKPLIDRCFAIMFRAGQDASNPASAGALPDLPKELIQAAQNGAHEMDVEYENMLAKAQQSGDVTAIQRLLQFVQAIATAHPDVLDMLNFDEMVKHLSSILGVPADLLNDEQVVQQLRDARQQAQAQQAQAQGTMGAAQAAGQAAPMVSAIGDIAGNPQASMALGMGQQNGAQAPAGR